MKQKQVIPLYLFAGKDFLTVVKLLFFNFTIKLAKE